MIHSQNDTHSARLENRQTLVLYVIQAISFLLSSFTLEIKTCMNTQTGLTININPNTNRIYRDNLINNGRVSAAVLNLHLFLLI